MRLVHEELPPDFVIDGIAYKTVVKELSTDAIIDACTSLRPDLDKVVVRSRPRETAAVLQDLQAAFKTEPTSGVGLLDRLPTELLWTVFRDLDIVTYFKFRHANRRARVLSTQFPEYQAIVNHGLEGLRGLLRVKRAQYFTIGHLYKRLISPECERCTNFGGFLFLLTATRCCFRCLEGSPELRVIDPCILAGLFKMFSKKVVEFLEPSLMHTVPGVYSKDRERVSRPQFLAVQRIATEQLKRFRILTTQSKNELFLLEEEQNQRFMAATAFPRYDPETGNVEKGITCKGCQSKPSQPEHEGYFTGRADFMYRRLEYMDHFICCKAAHEVWIQREDGTVPVPEEELARRRDQVMALRIHDFLQTSWRDEHGKWHATF